MVASATADEEVEDSTGAAVVDTPCSVAREKDGRVGTTKLELAPVPEGYGLKVFVYVTKPVEPPVGPTMVPLDTGYGGKLAELLAGVKVLVTSSGPAEVETSPE